MLDFIFNYNSALFVIGVLAGIKFTNVYQYRYCTNPSIENIKRRYNSHCNRTLKIFLPCIINNDKKYHDLYNSKMISFYDEMLTNEYGMNPLFI